MILSEGKVANLKLCDAIEKEYKKILKMLGNLETKSNKIIRKKLQNLKQIFRRNEEKEFAKGEAEIFGIIQQVKCSIVYLNDVKSEIEEAKYSYHLKRGPKQGGLMENEFSEKFESKLIYLIGNMSKTLSLRLSRIITHYQKFKIHVSDYDKKEKIKHKAISGKETISGRASLTGRQGTLRSGIPANVRKQRIDDGRNGKKRNPRTQQKH